MIRSDDLLREFFIDLQRALSRLLGNFYHGIDVEGIRVIVAVNAACKGDLMSVAAVKWDLKEGPLSKALFTCRPLYPYVPGLLFIREGPPMLHTIKQLGDGWQLLIVDGHGLLHPRKMGLAVFLGLILNKPSMGIAKSLLVGSEKPGDTFGEVEVDGEILGYWFRLHKSKKFYASPGYLVNIQQLPEIIKRLGNTYPEALKFVDRLSKKALKEALNQ